MKEQLVHKNCTTGEYNNIYPVTSLSSVKDLITGQTLDEMLENINHIYLPFKDNSRTLTRQQVPNRVRKKGLWITYTSCKGNVITEYYTSDDYSNRAWGDSSNWSPYLNKAMIKEVLREYLTWYKA